MEMIIQKGRILPRNQTTLFSINNGNIQSLTLHTQKRSELVFWYMPPKVWFSYTFTNTYLCVWVRNKVV